MPIRVGIIGYGLSGKVFHGNLIPHVDGFEVTVIYSSNPDKVRADFPDVEIVSAPEDLIKSDKVDLVIVTSPNTLHFPQTKLALESGKHVVVEKPFTVDAQEGYELDRIAKQQKRMLTVYQNRRWDADFLTIKKLVADGELGKVHTFKAQWDRYREKPRLERWREQAQPGAGVLYDLGAHLIDQALLLLGKPKSVFADVVKQREGSATDDYFVANIVFENGGRAVIGCGTLVHEKVGHHLTVHGDKGAYVKHDLDVQEDALKEAKDPKSADWGLDTADGILERVTADGHESKTIETLRGRYQTFYDLVRECIENGTYDKPPVDPLSSVAVIEVINAAQKSSDEGVRVNL